MVAVAYESLFKKKVKGIKDESLKTKVKKKIRKVLNSPTIGKPMRFSRKGTREVYIAPYRLSYMYIESEDKIIFLDLYHKDEQ
ncbi:MAG: type II toxin-antitoxin system RelE/ParE family toxin [Methanopyri archaeon]|jgi:mRNA-degrading endonuclease RelE of RelBE toxin-antitoxin system|nr:type II toxin-antitoxin system RelE/ParE family toxin [Methanopyri archaeon]